MWAEIKCENGLRIKTLNNLLQDISLNLVELDPITEVCDWNTGFGYDYECVCWHKEYSSDEMNVRNNKERHHGNLRHSITDLRNYSF